MKSYILAAALAGAVAAQPASALTIELYNNGGLAEGTEAYGAFRAAANYWESVITTDTIVKIDVSFYSQGVNGPVGGASAWNWSADVQSVMDAMHGNANSALDAVALANLPVANLPSTYAPGMQSIAMWKPAHTNGERGADPYNVAYDTDGSKNNSVLGMTWATGKALGLVYVDDLKDGSISFNSDLNFDFNPLDGITSGYYDFTFTATHEIGHILGFSTGVDYYDYWAPNDSYNWNWDWIGHSMDLFRYSELGLDWSMGGEKYFSIDGGATALFGGNLSTGLNYGNGFQASHWLENVGMMDPTSARGEMGVVRAIDLAVLDAIGWNVNLDLLSTPDYLFTTANIFGYVPEPQTWAMMIFGFGLVGGMLRRKRASLA